MSKNELTDTGEKFIHVLAWITGVFALFFFLFLVYWTVSSWLISLDPSKPKPHFIIVYVLGLFSTGILMSFSKFFSSINKLKSDNNDN